MNSLSSSRRKLRFFAGVKPDGFHRYMIPSRVLFAPKKVVPRVKLCSRLSFLRRTGFFIASLVKGRGTVAVRTVEGFCKDFRHNKKLNTKKNPLATPYGMWPSPL